MAILTRALTQQGNAMRRIGAAQALDVGNGITVTSGNLAITPAGGGFTELVGDVLLDAGFDLTAAAGSGEFDFSGQTGTFKTGTGAVSINGNATLASGKDLIAAGGSSDFDFSLSSGFTKTGTGNVTINGNTTFAANVTVSFAAGTGFFDASLGTGIFKTTTGAVTIGNGAVTVSGVTTFTAAGTALTVNNNATITGTLLVTGILTNTGGIYANGGVDRSGAATLSLGITNASAVDISKVAALTTVKGNFQVDGTTSLVGNVSTTNNLTVGGNLVVNGTTTIIGSTNTIGSDQFEIKNGSYTGATAVTTGFVFNTDPAATTFSISTVTGTNTFNVMTDPTGFIAAGDLILVTGANTAGNNNIFEVLSITTSSVTIKASPDASVTGIVGTLLTNDATAGGTLVKSLFSFMRADSGGSSFSVGFGSSTPITFNTLSASAATLQSAYAAGNTITTSGGSGNVTITGTEDFVVAGTVDISITSTGSITGTALTGAINLQTTGNVDLIGGTSLQVGDDVATLDFDGAGAVSETGMTSFSITPSGAITFTAGAASTWQTSAGALTITSAASATWSSAAVLTLNGATGLNLQAAGTTRISITTAGTTNISAPSGQAVNINTVAGTATTSIHVVPTGTITIGNNAAGAFSLSGGSTLTGIFSGTISFLANGGNVSFTSTTGSATFSGATTASLSSGTTLTLSAGTSFSMTGTANSNITISGASLTLSGSGVELQYNGTTGFSVQAANLTVQPAFTLDCTGTGTISLPNNTGASTVFFQIGGVAVSEALITAANFDILFAGPTSDASTLHTHTGIAASQTTITDNAFENLNTGAPASWVDNGGSPEVQHADANGTGTRPKAVGLIKLGVSTGNPVEVVIAGRLATPDAVWNTVPAVTDVGARFYLDNVLAQLILDVSGFTTGDWVVEMGTVLRGGAGNVEVLVHKGAEVLL